MDKVANIFVSDSHTNSTVGLMPPSVNLDDGGTYRASKSQRWMWRSWLDFNDWAKDLTKGYRRIVHVVGDAGELDTKRRSWQIVTSNPTTVLDMMYRTYEPILDWVDGAMIYRGTPAHVGKSSFLEEKFAEDLDIAIKDDERDTFSWWHARFTSAGVRFDVAHHARMGGLPWTERNAANKLAAVTMYRYLEMGQPPPNVIIRADQHRWADSGGNFDDVFAVYLPCWSLKTEFVYRIGQENSVPRIGGAVFLCEDGEYTWRKRIYQPRMTNLWRQKI